jgi:aspartate/methionine/tyrosine aminotransferase
MQGISQEKSAMNPIAAQLNTALQQAGPHLFEMLSTIGRNLYFPRGILSQSAEAKEKAWRLNATIGIARESGRTMRFDSVAHSLGDIRPAESLTYAPSFGIPALRKIWQRSLFEKNPSLAGKRISLPVVTSGITHAVSTFAELFLDPGEPIVLPEMMWGNYNLIFSTRRAAEVRTYPFFTPAGGLDVEALGRALREACAGRDKISLLLNFPHNPSGYTLTEAEADKVVALLLELAQAGKNVVAALDDSYFGLFYTPETLKESLFARLAGRHPRLLAVKLDGATKENFVWGLRVGFITFGAALPGDAAAVYDALERKTAGCVRGTISNASHLGQTIVLRSMTGERFPDEKEEKYGVLAQRARKVREVLADPRFAAAWEPYPFNSGYFMCLRLKTVDAEALRLHLLERHGVGLIALGERNLRVAFSCIDAADIPELFDTILKGIGELENGARNDR